MKPVVAPFLGFVFFTNSIFPHTHVEEISKTHNLIGHYFGHCQMAAEQFTFREFPGMYYGLDSTHAKSHQSNHRQPMFHQHCAGLTFILPTYITFPQQSVIVRIPDQYVHYQNTYAYLFPHSFLRPPQAG